MVFRKIVRVWNCWGTWLRCLPGQRGSWSLEAILSMGSMRKWGENNQIIHTLVKQIVETQHYRNVGCSQQTCSFASLWEFICSHGLPVFFVDKKWQPTLNYWNGTSKESLPRMPGVWCPLKNQDTGNQLQETQKMQIQKQFFKELGVRVSHKQHLAAAPAGQLESAHATLTVNLYAVRVRQARSLWCVSILCVWRRGGARYPGM